MNKQIFIGRVGKMPECDINGRSAHADLASSKLITVKNGLHGCKSII